MDMLTYDEFPGIPPLVHETIAGISHIDYGFRTYPDPVAWVEQSKSEAKHERPIGAIADTIRKQYGDLPLTQAVRQNLDALTQPGTMAVVTGQQVGIAGGPLLTLYKAMTTIALAERLERGTGVRTVPIFWMATSDHNLPECAQSHWIDLNNQLSSYKDTKSGNRFPVGSLKLGNRAEDLLQKLITQLPSTEFSADVLNSLRSAYAPEHTFADAFRRFWNDFLGTYGLVFFDPEDPEIKRLSAPFMRKAAAEVDDRLAILVERSQMIERAGYKSQAPIEPGRPALFLLEEGQRRKIVLEGKAIRGMSDLIISRDKLVKLAETEPERLSAGVTLRPMLQGWLLPTGAYVAGPHEMAYWAQLPGAFAPLGIHKPAVVPRASLTLVEPKVERWLNKYELQPSDIFAGEKELSKRLLASRRDDETDHALADLDADLKSHERILTDMTRDGDFGGLDTLVESSFGKMRYHVDKLRHGFSERLMRRHGTLLKHVEQLSTHLFPGGIPQERVISPVYYLIRYGNSMLDGLNETALQAVGRHMFINLKEWQ
ncbi:bacillithiol biosynthesis cysteine-adding enzyme BshC [bacterium]|nr:bacillithiol biosynthesis cysteine-adding enzyme BshC [bacterium]